MIRPHPEVRETAGFSLYAGSLPGRALSMMREWLALHRAELETDWELAQQKKLLNPINPLE